MLKTALATVVLLLCLEPAAGSPGFDTLETQLRAVGSVSVVKYYNQGVTTYYLWHDGLGYGQWYNVYPHIEGEEHAVLLFDLAALPDTADLLTAELSFFQHSDDTAGTPPFELRGFDYAGQEPESLFAAAEGGALVAPGREAHRGWNRVPLPEVGVGWLRARLAGDSARLAIKTNAWGELGYAYGSTAPETLRPCLLLSYLPTAVEEDNGSRIGSVLLVAPNPARGGLSIRYALPIAGPVKLRLYDESGALIRNVLAGHRDAGIHLARVSPPALRPGIYFVELKAGHADLVRKFAVVR